MLDSAYPRVIPGPPRPSRILTPASLTRHPGRERYEVPGGGALLIRLGAGDRVTVTNAEGGQVCELVAADGQGRIDAGILGVAGQFRCAGAEGAAGRRSGSGLARLRLGIERRGIDLAPARARGAVRRRNPGGDATRASRRTRDGVLVVAAPGLPMAPGAQDTATPLVLTVQRADPDAVGRLRPAGPAGRSGAGPAGEVGHGARAISSRRATISRSSTWTGGNARISSAFPRASWTGASSMRWT